MLGRAVQEYPAVTTSPIDQILQEADDLARSGRLTDALAAYKHALKSEPSNLAAHYRFGSFLSEVGHHDDALPYLKSAYDSDPNRESRWLRYITALLHTHRLDDARRVLMEGMQTAGFTGGNVLAMFAMYLSEQQAAAPKPKQPLPLPDVADADFYKLLAKAWPYSMSSIYGFVDSFHALYQTVDYIAKRNIPGDFVECGTYLGGMSLIAALAFMKHGDTSRHFYLFDTFEGMPAPTEEDGRWLISAYDKETLEGHEWAKADMETVRKIMLASGYPAENIHLVKGMVEDTIPHAAPDKIAILRLDTDLYTSTHHELVHLYPRLTAGGALVLDDYGYMPGAKKAVDEYFTRHPAILLNRINFTVRVGIKV